MTVLDDFQDVMASDVTIQPMTGRDRYGKPVYGAPVVVPGRFVVRSKLVMTPAGQEAVSSSFVTVAPTAGLAVDSRVSIDGVERPVIAVEQAPDETGAIYYQRVRFA